MEKILVAKIVKPQGIKGEVKCQVFTDVLSVFEKDIPSLQIGKRNLKIKKMIYRVGFLFVKFEGVDTRDDAEGLRNEEIYLDKSFLQECIDDEILIDDLIGVMLFDENQNQIGQIVDVENYGASDIITILEDNHEFQVPFTNAIFKTDEQNRLYVLKEEYDNSKI